ncbi:site-specific DNA-methyltransferase [Asanoa sp. NPDC049518]|uniref:DNA-methyltransferase n=1 Tax=unclassified Asanoa TaxID=2685164 RepID=UPI0034382384
MATVDPVSASGDLLGEVRRGDAYDLMGELAPDSVDLIITSPPYWGLRTYGQSHNAEILREWMAEEPDSARSPTYEWYREHGGLLGMEPIPEWFVDHLVEIFQRGARALKPRGSMWINIGDTYFARWSSIRYSGRQGMGDNPRERRRTPMGGYRQEKQLLMIPARFAIAMQSARWILRNDLIWHKPNVAPRPERDRLRLAHEHFYHFVKRPKEGRASYWYDMDEVEEGARDVVTVNVRAGSDGHSATFPEALIKPRILSSCDRGGLVLDPFAGTGRALTVAIENDRSAIGFEVSDSFAEAARRNVEDALKRSAVRELL